MKSVAQASKPCSGDAQATTMMAKRPDSMNIRSNANDNMAPPFFTLQSSTYNIPDGRESNADIVRGEMMFFNTPLMEKYSQDSYNALKNVQAQCSIDYQSNCATSSPFMQLHSMIEELFRPDDAVVIRSSRRLTEKLGSFKNGAELISYLRSFYSGPTSVLAHMDRLFNTQHPLSKVMWRNKEGKLVSPEGKKDKIGQIEKELQQKRIHTNVVVARKEDKKEENNRELTKEEKEAKAEMKAEKAEARAEKESKSEKGMDKNKILSGGMKEAVKEGKLSGGLGGPHSHVHIGPEGVVVRNGEEAPASLPSAPTAPISSAPTPATPALAPPTPFEKKVEKPVPQAVVEAKVEAKVVENMNAAHKRQLRSGVEDTREAADFAILVDPPKLEAEAAEAAEPAVSEPLVGSAGGSWLSFDNMAPWRKLNPFLLSQQTPAQKEDVAEVQANEQSTTAKAEPAANKNQQYAPSYDRSLPLPPRSAPLMIPGVNSVQPLSGFQKFILDFLFNEGVGINMATPDPSANVNTNVNSANDKRFNLQVKSNAQTMNGGVTGNNVGGLMKMTTNGRPDFIIIGGPPSFLPGAGAAGAGADNDQDDYYANDQDDAAYYGTGEDDTYASNANDDDGYYYTQYSYNYDDAAAADDAVQVDDGSNTVDNEEEEEEAEDDYYQNDEPRGASLSKDNKKFVPVGGLRGGSSRLRPLALGPVIPAISPSPHSPHSPQGKAVGNDASEEAVYPIGKDSIKPRNLGEGLAATDYLTMTPSRGSVKLTKSLAPGKQIKSLIDKVVRKAAVKLNNEEAPIDPSPHPGAGAEGSIDPNPHPGHQHDEPPPPPHPRPTPPQGSGGDEREIDHPAVVDSSEEEEGEHHHSSHHGSSSSEEASARPALRGPTTALLAKANLLRPLGFPPHHLARHHQHDSQEHEDHKLLVQMGVVPPFIHPTHVEGRPAVISLSAQIAPPPSAAVHPFLQFTHGMDAPHTTAASPPRPAGVPPPPGAAFGHPGERPQFKEGEAGSEEEVGEGDHHQLGKDDHDYRDHKDKNEKDHDKHHKKGGWWGPHDSSSEEDPHHPHHPPHPHGPPPPPVPPDTSFQGYIGYGSDGDMCMYRSMAQGKVSDNCMQAVQQVYELRNEYWTEYQQQQAPPPHHHFFIFLLLLGTCAFVIAKKIKNAPRRKQLRSLLTFLHTNPELKAHVEKESGVNVPLPMTQHGCLMTEYTGTNSANSCYLSECCCTFGRGLAVAIGLLAVALVVNFTSLILTMHVVGWMDRDAPIDPETGEPQGTSQAFTLFILFSFISLQLVGIAALVRTCRRRREARQRLREEETQNSPSRPLLNSSEHGSSNNQGGHTLGAFHAVAPVSPVRQWFRNAASAVKHWRRNNFNGSVNDGYTSLPADESTHGNEMISMSAYPGAHSQTSRTVNTHPSSIIHHQPTNGVNQNQQYVAPQVMLQSQMVNGQTVLVPISARPVNAVSLVQQQKKQTRGRE